MYHRKQVSTRIAVAPAQKPDSSESARTLDRKDDLGERRARLQKNLVSVDRREQGSRILGAREGLPRSTAMTGCGCGWLVSSSAEATLLTQPHPAKRAEVTGCDQRRTATPGRPAMTISRYGFLRMTTSAGQSGIRH